MVLSVEYHLEDSSSSRACIFVAAVNVAVAGSLITVIFGDIRIFCW